MSIDIRLMFLFYKEKFKRNLMTVPEKILNFLKSTFESADFSDKKPLCNIKEKYYDSLEFTKKNLSKVLAEITLNNFKLAKADSFMVFLKYC